MAPALNKAQSPSFSHDPVLLSAELSVSAEAFDKPQFSNAAASAAFAVHDMEFALNDESSPIAAPQDHAALKF